MRTKTLLIAAAALAAGIISSEAQVYSQNIVGYVNTALPAGYTLVSVPVSPNSTNNAEAILPALTSGDVILLWNGSGYNVDYYNGPGDWFDGVTFNPISQPNIPAGGAIYYQNNTGKTVTNTFVGTVTLTNTVSLAAGYTMIGSTLPIGGSLEDTNLALPFTSGDVVLIWNGSGYNVDYYNGPGDWFDGVTFNPISVPSITVGAGFFYQNNTGHAVSWTQNLVVQ